MADGYAVLGLDQLGNPPPAKVGPAKFKHFPPIFVQPEPNPHPMSLAVVGPAPAPHSHLPGSIFRNGLAFGIVLFVFPASIGYGLTEALKIQQGQILPSLFLAVPEEQLLLPEDVFLGCEILIGKPQENVPNLLL